MTLSKNGLSYICENFGDVNLCCVRTGLSWYTTMAGAEDLYETGGTYQIVNRLVLGLCDSLTMTNPDRGTFTKAELDAVNGSPVSLEDTKLIAQHDDVGPLVQWCFGDEPPPPPGIPWALILTSIGLAAVAGVIVWQVKK